MDLKKALYDLGEVSKSLLAVGALVIGLEAVFTGYLPQRFGFFFQKGVEAAKNPNGWAYLGEFSDNEWKRSNFDLMAKGKWISHANYKESDIVVGSYLKPRWRFHIRANSGSEAVRVGLVDPLDDTDYCLEITQKLTNNSYVWFEFVQISCDAVESIRS